MILPPLKPDGILVHPRNPEPDVPIGDQSRWIYPGDHGYGKAKAEQEAELDRLEELEE